MNARNLLVAAFAGGGVLAAHWLGYRAAAHGDHQHADQLLVQSGHRYFTYVIAAIAALTALILWRYVSHRLNELRSPDVGGFQLFAQAAIRLIPLQGIAFLILELAERAITQGGLVNVFAEPAVLMGLFFQIVVGVIGGILVAAFAGAVEAIRRRSLRLTARRPIVRIYPKSHVLNPSKLSLAEGGLGLRGPPSLQQ
jgi:hypothetical protein